MKYYNTPVRTKTRIDRNETMEGEPMEKALQRLINNGDTNLTTKDLIYTRPEDGVVYGADIRGDKWDKAIENAEKVTEHVRNQRSEKYKKRKEELAELRRIEKEKKSGKKDTDGSIQANSKTTD